MASEREGIDMATDLNDAQVKGLAEYYENSLRNVLWHFDNGHDFSGSDAFRVAEAVNFLKEIANGKVVF